MPLPPVEYGRAKPKHHLEYLLFAAFSALLRWPPRSISILLAKGLAALAHRILEKKNRDQRQQIRECLGCDETEAHRILRSSYDGFTLNWLAQMDASKVISADSMVFHGLEHIQGEGGVVIAAMHLGMWEAVPFVFQEIEHPLAITVAVQHNPLVDRRFNDLRSRGGYHHILHNRLGIRHTFEHLKGGGTLIILSDVDIGGSGAAVPFLGRTASTPTWPAEMARRTKSDLVVGYTRLSKEGELHLHLEPISYAPDAGTQEILVAMNERMSEAIRRYPEQWFWMQRRFKTPLRKIRGARS